MNGIIDENLVLLGLAGIEVFLYDSSDVLVDTVTTDSEGGFTFEIAPGAMYRVTLNQSMLPTELMYTSVTPGPFSVSQSGASVALNFGYAPNPTAIQVESFEALATGNIVQISWEVPDDGSILGFRLWRGNEEQPLTQIGELFLAHDSISEVRDVLSTSFYWLEIIDNSLNSDIVASALVSRLASPKGVTTRVITAEEGRVEIDAKNGETILVIGFSSPPVAIEPQTGVIIIGEIVEVEGEFGIYLTLPISTRLQIQIAE